MSFFQLGQELPYIYSIIFQFRFRNLTAEVKLAFRHFPKKRFSYFVFEAEVIEQSDEAFAR